MDKWASYSTCIEIGINERCNLKCPLCSQNIPSYTTRYPDTDFETIEKLSSLLKGQEFYMLKISGGGEPTLHKDFGKIAIYLKENVKADNYVIATNGCKVLNYIKELQGYRVEISHYPGQNDDTIAKLKEARLPSNYNITVKRVGIELVDIHTLRPNKGRAVSRFKCEFYVTKKILRGRISPCCLSSGICQMLNIPFEKYSLELKENFLEEVNKIDISELCQECAVSISS
jgi:uncharacterized radical SAM superfamily Fe-S cluster-containing enzyme